MRRGALDHEGKVTSIVWDDGVRAAIQVKPAERWGDPRDEIIDIPPSVYRKAVQRFGPVREWKGATVYGACRFASPEGHPGSYTSIKAVERSGGATTPQEER